MAGIDALTSWINKNRNNIVNFFRGIGETIQTKVIPFILQIVDAFNTIRDWVKANSETIGKFFSTLGEIVAKVFENLFGTKIQIGGGLEGFLEGVTEFMQFVIDNKDKIAEWATILLEVFLAFQLIGTVINIVMGVVIAILAPILALAVLLAGLIGLWSILGGVITAVAGFIVTILIPGILLGIGIFIAIIAIIAMVVAALFAFWLTLQVVMRRVAEFSEIAIAKFNELRDGAISVFMDLVAEVLRTVENIKSTFGDQPWGTIGRGIIEGVTRGVIHAVQGLINAVVNAVEDAYDAALDAIGMSSPSRLFMNVGEGAMQGMAKGITDAAGLAVGAMQGAMAAIVSPALALPNITQQIAVAAVPSLSSNTSYTNNFNLTVNSGAPTEPIIQDYNMMKSLVQG